MVRRRTARGLKLGEAQSPAFQIPGIPKRRLPRSCKFADSAGMKAQLPSFPERLGSRMRVSISASSSHDSWHNWRRERHSDTQRKEQPIGCFLYRPALTCNLEVAYNE